MKTKTKLSLNRETVLNLTIQPANQIKGGCETGVGICNHTRDVGRCPIPKITDICDTNGGF
jgi:hypothetical protein